MDVYWITGASSGIGEALARKLAQDGHKLILSARNTTKLETLRASLPNPDSIKILSFDLSKMDSYLHVARDAWSLFGSIQVIILNAGLSQRALAQEAKLSAFRELMEVNYFGNVALTQQLLPFFIQKNQGHFVVISSLVGKFGTPYRSGYAASKHALHGYYDSLRAEMMMQKISVDITIICPGFVNTNISYNALGSSGEATHSYDQGNANGISPETFANRSIPIIKAKKYEAYIGGSETIGVWIKRFFPGVFAKKIAKAKVR